ncbi:hypothetical protein GCM10008097_21040 [Mycetocola manganoxydans]|nr:hypothetical protein GCM10008097_21040 [Mycetocola manganoxydans]
MLQSRLLLNEHHALDRAGLEIAFHAHGIGRFRQFDADDDGAEPCVRRPQFSPNVDTREILHRAKTRKGVTQQKDAGRFPPPVFRVDVSPAGHPVRGS